MGLGKLFTKGASKVLSKADKAKLAREAAEARKLKENQKKPANTLQSKSKTEQKESGMGTESKTRVTSGERGKALAGAKREYKATLTKLDKDPNLSDEQMEIMMGKLKDLEKRYGAGVKPTTDMKRGGKVTKKVPVISIGVGMAEMPKGKAKMMRGGMSGGKEHMYAAGGMVKDNPGLKALKAASPEAYNKITKS